mgnify:CR=1 FL=1
MYTRVGDRVPDQYTSEFPYPRRRPLRYILRRLSRVAFSILCDLRISGQANLPASGPLLVVSNHFHFADPVAIVRATPWPLEFLGGHNLVDAPLATSWLPRLWGYYAVRRGAASRNAIRASTAVLRQKGVLAVFPEGGSWAPVLRPARPGTAFLAARTGAPLLPLGLHGLFDIFPSLGCGRRAKVTVRIGKPFGPFHLTAKGPRKRLELEAIGYEIMQRIAELIPPEQRGVYSQDPALRAAARAAAVYPWQDEMEP